MYSWTHAVGPILSWTSTFPHVWAQEAVRKAEAGYMGLNLWLDIQSSSGRPSHAPLSVFQVMVLKEETGSAYIPAARAAVQAAERESRPELCTDPQAAVSNYRNLFEYWNPMLLPLHVSTTSLKHNQPHPDMLLKIWSGIHGLTHVATTHSSPQFLFFSVKLALGNCHMYCPLALFSSISLSSSTTKRISRFPCMHAGCVYD